MRDGFIRVASVSPDIRVCDVDYNKESIKKAIEKEWENKSSIIVFPELCLTAYTCNDLFFQDSLISEAKKALKEIVDFMHKLGADSLTMDENYWASLALWTWEMTPLDMAKAYSVFANMWEKIDVNPILKIVDSKGNVVEELKNPKKEKVMPEGQAFLINEILSDSSTRPAWWNSYLSIWRSAATKTWTSTKPIKQNWKTVQYPANLWTIWYTPQITTVVWSWNTDWETLKFSWNWLEASWPIWRDFMKASHSWKEAQDWKKPADVKNVTISEISWYLPNPEKASNNFLVSSYFINPPKKIDNSYTEIQYDALCNWKVTDETPADAIKKSIILEFHSLKPDNPAWERPVQAWAKSAAVIEKYWESSGAVAVKDEVCKRNGGWEITIKSNISSSQNYDIWPNRIELAFTSTSIISKIDVLVNWETVNSIPVNKTSWWISQIINIPERFANSRVTIELRAINQEFYSASEKKEIAIWNASKNNTNPLDIIVEDTNKPAQANLDISITNPKNSSIKIYQKDYFNLRFNVSPKEKLSSVNIFINNESYKTLWNWWDYTLPINQNEKLEVWINNLKIQAINSSGEKKEKMLQIEVMKE